MALLEIRKYPDKILKEKTILVTNLNGETQRLIDDMIETMYAVNGVGLAANQVGVSKRLCVIDVSARGEKRPLMVLINPVLVSKEGTQNSEEGCLSVPGFITNVKRAEKVLVKAHDRQGNPLEIEATAFLAKVLQHELDHLDGLLLIDRISPIKREFFKKRYKKFLKSLQENK